MNIEIVETVNSGHEKRFYITAGTSLRDSYLACHRHARSARRSGLDAHIRLFHPAIAPGELDWDNGTLVARPALRA